jgi:hypothetical protein
MDIEINNISEYNLIRLGLDGNPKDIPNKYSTSVKAKYNINLVQGK